MRLLARLPACLLALLLTLLLGGCADIGYLSQSVGGHLQLLHAARPVDEWLARRDLDPRLRQRLLLARQMREFAVDELKLPDNDSYRSYADLHRSAAVWNVVAAPALSLTPKTWCYPVMGCVAYRGYFDPAAATALGSQLRAEGLDVMVYPVPAYSTLGWTRDPILNTFIEWNDGALAGLIFHELAHQEAYASGDTTFNESFATTVERLGAAAWLAAHGSAAEREQYSVDQQRQAQFSALTLDYQTRLRTLYASTQDDAAKRAGKAALLQALRADYARLKAGPWQGYAGYDHWFAQANNASFALLSAYTALIPSFEALFEQEGRDWTRFYAEVRRLAKLPAEQRRAELISVNHSAFAAPATH